MSKIFEYKEVKELIKYFNNLLNKLKNTSIIKQECFNDLNKTIKDLVRKEYFSNLVEKTLRGENTLSFDKDFIYYLVNLYNFMKISRYAEDSNHLYQSNSKLIEKSISDLSVASNAVVWLLSSKKKKTIAEEAFTNLKNIKNDNFVVASNEVLENVKSLKAIDADVIKEDYTNNKGEYKNWIEDIGYKVLPNYGVVNLFKNYINEYKSLSTKISDISNSINTTIADIKQSIDKLLAEELIKIMKGIPVEELARDKSGIKIKYLKDAGYDSLASIHGATVMQLASIYGISQDKAYTIKAKCDNYAKKVYSGLKIKLSIDNKTFSATKVVNDIYVYLQKIEYQNMLDDINKKYGNTIKKGINVLDGIGSGIIWPFLSDYEIEGIKEYYSYIEDNFSLNYKAKINQIYNAFKNQSFNTKYAWNDFADNSIRYYNIIEEVYPNVLGSDDAIYGLPEKLAREIQEQCFFPDGLLCTLRKYQEWGVKYILHQEKVLLGDEMGLGKTVQAIAVMVSLRNTGATHFMVVCPASVVTNWCREIIKHSKLKPTKIHGKGKEQAFKSWLKTGGVAVTNFESTSYIKLEENDKFDLLVVDEAHYIKNTGAQRSLRTRNLASHTKRLLFMTGTALENNVDEMISLIDVLRPSIANSIKKYAFMSSAPQFREKIAPVYYRRKREDVLTELPDKIEIKEWCTLNLEEELAYEDAILNKEYNKSRRVSWNIDDLSKSSKAQRLKEIVDEAKEDGRKVLVFSFFLDTISKIHDFLKGKCLNPINGSVNVNRRQEIIDEFDKAQAGTVLLAQITSGGTGLNIQSASVVVICEPQFKPSIENQAISRAYRMGQTRNVLVYRLLCEETIDERLTQILEDKQKLFDAFADKSVAAEEKIEIDGNTFVDIINEEIERINKKRGMPSETSQNTRVTTKKEILVLDKYEYNPIVVSEKGKEYYSKIMQMSYNELVQFLLNKYGPAKYDYFTNEQCTSKNKNVTRTSEGLYCHHIDEDKAILLSNDKYAPMNPFEYQKADRLVYCNYLEHVLLHILIVEEPKNIYANDNEVQGIGGLMTYMCPQLNDLYTGYKFQQQWLINIMSVVKNDYESYIIMLKRLWKAIKNDPLLSSLYKKEDLAKGWDGTIHLKILNDI